MLWVALSFPKAIAEFRPRLLWAEMLGLELIIWPGPMSPGLGSIELYTLRSFD